MQHRSLLRTAALLVAVSFLLVRCSKGGEGPTGPAGPAGANGAPGPAGPAGTANVIFSPWLDVTYTVDKAQNGDTLGYFANITADKLTVEILNGGEMKVYFNYGSSAQPDVAPMPITDPFYGLFTTVDFFVKRIYLYSNFNASTVTQSGNKIQQHRYILIPGGTGARVAKPDWNDYNKVKAFYNLPD
ncbi:hypothetical protein [Paraflavitalea speifideaquila]|uniref:hypothetical protein n=1 Tax=Paraflavitalea speifideaquila TaxID=3076558 RepID=UPI0028E9CAC2|nr:hypothetical protein [Paraflavitalea speifideiaquila]